METWRKLGCVKEKVLRWLTEGVRLEWKSGHPPEHIRTIPQSHLDPEDMKAMDAEVEEQVKLGALREVPPTFPKLLLPVFVVDKKGGGKRPVINATPLNDWVRAPHFKMEGIPTVEAIVQRDDWMLTLDIAKAYVHLPLHPEAQEYLCFRWAGKVWSYTALPFGLNLAPRAFTKTLRGVVGEIRRRGVRCTIYIDDLLLAATSPKAVTHHMAFAILLLTELFFSIKRAKTPTVPRQLVEYLGVLVDSVRMELRLPLARMTRALVEIRRWARETTPLRVRKLARLIGTLASFKDCLAPTHLYLRALNRLKQEGVNREGWEGQILLSPEAKEELLWWEANLRVLNGKGFAIPTPTCVIQTDASGTGWGAVLRKGEVYQETMGTWDESDRPLSICPRELKAGLLAVRTFSSLLENQSVLWHSDNSAVVWSTRRWKSMAYDMNTLLRQLWYFCREHHIRLQTMHVAGEQNWRPDFLSRLQDEGDWQLHPRVFHLAQKLLGPCEVDAFATRRNALLPRYWSRLPEEGAEAHDCFQQNMATSRCWCNPPFSEAIILRLLHQVRSQRATATVCLPHWPTAAWWPLMMGLLTHPPLLLPATTDLFRPVFTGNRAGVGPPPWPVIVARVSGHPAPRAKAHQIWGQRLSEISRELLKRFQRTWLTTASFSSKS